MSDESVLICECGTTCIYAPANDSYICLDCDTEHKYDWEINVWELFKHGENHCYADSKCKCGKGETE